ncbi:MAG: hypothetical protein J1F35_01715 [Erysipelotrichales bacterium]|nr:hypothetical protein [Erysipelotrichales bacterium]
MDSSEEANYEVLDNTTGKNKIYIVRDVKTLVYISENAFLCGDTIRLVLNSIDEELVEMLISLNMQFEIVYELKEQSYTPFELLKKFMQATNNKVYVSYNIDNKSEYDKVLIDYYIYYYGVIVLLETTDRALYNEWVQELTRRVEKKSIRKLNKRYVGERKV